MTSAYGGVNVSSNTMGSELVRKLSYIPIDKVVKNGQRITIDFLRDENDVDATRKLMNGVIIDGMSWPFVEPLSDLEFRKYFLSHSALVARNPSGEVVGAFYCKPNFPGRCAHWCNGGFITDSRHQGRGIGTAMGEMFLRVAKDLGFKAAMFNLVFTCNSPSIRIWQKLGFQQLSRLPRIGHLREGTFDAFQFYYDLTQSESNERKVFTSIVRQGRKHVTRVCLFVVAFLIGRRSAHCGYQGV